MRFLFAVIAFRCSLPISAYQSAVLVESNDYKHTTHRNKLCWNKKSNHSIYCGVMIVLCNRNSPANDEIKKVHSSNIEHILVDCSKWSMADRERECVNGEGKARNKNENNQHKNGKEKMLLLHFVKKVLHSSISWHRPKNKVYTPTQDGSEYGRVQSVSVV